MAIKVRGEAGLVRSLMLARGPWPGSTLPPPAALPFLLLLERATPAPPLGAGPLSVTVPVEELPPVTLVGLRLSDESVGGAGVTVSEADRVVPRSEEHTSELQSRQHVVFLTLLVTKVALPGTVTLAGP